MDPSRRIHQAVAIALLPVFVMASVVCVCEDATAGEIPGGRQSHHCCPENSRQASHDHRADCSHCGHSQVTAKATLDAPAVHVASSPWTAALPSPTKVRLPLWASALRPVGQVSSPYPSRTIFATKCALLI